MNNISKILLLDDEAGIRKIIPAIIKRKRPKWQVLTAANTREGFELLEKNKDIKVILVDYLLPEDLSGIDFLNVVKSEDPSITRILLTGIDPSKDLLINAINKEIIHRYIGKPVEQDTLLVVLQQSIERTNLIRSNTSLERELFHKNKELKKLNQGLNEQVKKQAGQLLDAYLNIINAFTLALESRDPHTIGHSKKVAYYSEQFSEYLGLSECERFEIYLGALLHDLGKLTIPENILLKKGTLDNKEMMIMRSHSEAGYNLINRISLPWNIKDILLYHHEKWDGSGYPKKLKGEEIPLKARIVSIADTVDAMLSDRIYRKAFSVEDIIAELKRGAGSQFDPKLVQKFIEMYNSGGIKFVRTAPDFDFLNKLYINNCQVQEVKNDRKQNETFVG